MKQIKWEGTLEDARIISLIAKRAVELARKYSIDYDYAHADMDITATHLNGCPLNLACLLDAKDSDFGHDVFGIRRFINRKTGQLEDCFVPRTAKIQKATGAQ